MTDETTRATVGFLHTAESHVGTFATLLGEIAPPLRGHHLVDADLLATARERGVGGEVERRLREDLVEIADRGAGVVLCTCSTLAGTAERLGAHLAVPVIRVDRPMAQRAVEHAGRGAGRIGVVAALDATVGPTRALIEDCAAAAGAHVEVTVGVAAGAWDRFEAGDLDGYADALATAVRDLVGTSAADVVVLAQASAAPAADRVGELAVPVLTSPRTAVEDAVAALRTGG